MMNRSDGASICSPCTIDETASLAHHDTCSSSNGPNCIPISSSSLHCHCTSIRVLVEERNELKEQLNRMQEELAVTSRENHQSAQLGLQLLEQKDELQKRFDDLEHAYDNTRNELQAVRRALNISLTSHKESANTGIEQEESLLQESAKKDATFASTLAELERELKCLRFELDRVQSEKDSLLAEHCDISKQLDLHDWERKSIRSELKDLKLRESRLLQELNELEDENVSLRKQVSTLRSSQIDFELAKDEISHLQDELEIRRLQVEEYESLKNIAEKQMLEALEALECEREEKYELKKKLDERIHFNCALGSLGLRFTSHSNDKLSKRSSNFTLHSIASSGSSNNEQFIIEESKQIDTDRSRSSCISSSSFTYFDNRVNRIRDSFVRNNKLKENICNNIRCLSSDVITPSLSNDCSISSTCILPDVDENQLTRTHRTCQDVTDSENNDKNNLNDNQFHGDDDCDDVTINCQSKASSTDKALFTCDPSSPCSLTSVTLTSGNSSGTPNSSYFLTPVTTCYSGFVNSSQSSSSLYLCSTSTSTSSTSPAPIVSIVSPIVTSKIVESCVLTGDDETLSTVTQVESCDSESTSNFSSKSVNCGENIHSHANSFESCISTIGNHDSSSCSSYYTCHSSSGAGKICTNHIDTDESRVVSHLQREQVCEMGKKTSDELCQSLGNKMSSSSSCSDIYFDNKSADIVDGNGDSTINSSVADSSLIDTVDFVKSNARSALSSDSNDAEDTVKHLSGNRDADKADDYSCGEQDELIIKCVPNGDDKMSNFSSTDPHKCNCNFNGKCIKSQCFTQMFPSQCYSMSTSTSLLEANQSVASNKESYIFNANTGAANLAPRVNKVNSVDGFNVNNYSPSADIHRSIVSSDNLNDYCFNENTDTRVTSQEEMQKTPLNSCIESRGKENKQVSLKDDLHSLLSETDVIHTRNILRYDNTKSDNQTSVTNAVKRPKSLMSEFDSHTLSSNKLLENYLNATLDSSARSAHHFGRINSYSSVMSHSKSTDVFNNVPVCNTKVITASQSTDNNKSTPSLEHHQLNTSITDVSNNMAKYFPKQLYASPISSISTATTSTCTFSTSSTVNSPSNKHSLRQSNSDYLLSNIHSSRNVLSCNLYPFSSEQLNSCANRKSNGNRYNSNDKCEDDVTSSSIDRDNHFDDVSIEKHFKSNILSSNVASNDTLINMNNRLISRKCVQKCRSAARSKINCDETVLQKKLISYNKCNKSKLLHQLNWLSCSTLNHQSCIMMTSSRSNKRIRKSLITHKCKNDSKGNYIRLYRHIPSIRKSTGHLYVKKRKQNDQFIVSSEPDHLDTCNSFNAHNDFDANLHTSFCHNSLNDDCNSQESFTSESVNLSVDCNHHSSFSCNNLHKILNCDRFTVGDAHYATVKPRNKRHANDDATASERCLPQLHIKSNVNDDDNRDICVSSTLSGKFADDKCNTSNSGCIAVESSANVRIDESENNDATSNIVGNLNNRKKVNASKNDDVDIFSSKGSTGNNRNHRIENKNAVCKVKNKLPAIATIYTHDLDKIDKFDPVHSSYSLVNESNCCPVKLNKYHTLSESFHDNLTQVDATDDAATVTDLSTIYNTIPATASLLSNGSRKNTDVRLSSLSRSRCNVCYAAYKAIVRAFAGCFLELFAP